jgi:hemerythrin superfamily protein
MPERDAITVLTDDHERVERLFREYEAATDAAEQTRIAHTIIHELAVHGEIEELLFYPRLRTVLPDGDALADEAIEEHLAMKHTLNDLDGMTADDPDFDPRMRALMAEMRHHVGEEEQELFPRARDALSADELADLADALEGARRMVPTRPHPAAPTGPLGKLATSPPVALVDRVRDAVRGWRDDRR